ncbi:hypothetical protein [Oxalicibacterium solurbis]|nr:hypothetical protein [Oxalicibacterium solurbis]
MANPSHTAPDPVSANTAVPTLQYQSSFASYRAAVDEEATPDARWISANQEVTGGGHSMHGMHDMQTSSPAPMQMNMQAHEGHEMGGH